jgi:hypothetical protein
MRKKTHDPLRGMVMRGPCELHVNNPKPPCYVSLKS